jgi:hypothetical protein
MDNTHLEIVNIHLEIVNTHLEIANTHLHVDVRDPLPVKALMDSTTKATYEWLLIFSIFGFGLQCTKDVFWEVKRKGKQ